MTDFFYREQELKYVYVAMYSSELPFSVARLFCAQWPALGLISSFL
jgi:hypothetical protein